MKLNRRKALGFLAAVPVAGPKVAAEQMSGVALGAGAEAAALGMGFATPGPGSAGGGYARALKLFGGIPDWLRNEWRDHAKSSARLIDTDVAVLRSTSLAHKVMTQRERYVRMREEEIMGASLIGDARDRWHRAIWGQS